MQNEFIWYHFGAFFTKLVRIQQSNLALQLWTLDSEQFELERYAEFVRDNNKINFKIDFHCFVLYSMSSRNNFFISAKFIEFSNQQ